MGAGIAQVSVDKGFEVFLKDATASGLSRGLNQVYGGLDKALKRKKITRFVKKKLVSFCTKIIKYVFSQL